MKTQYLCLILLIFTPLMIQAAASQEPEPKHLIRLVASERIWSNDNKSVVTIPIQQHEIKIMVNNKISNVKTDDIGELPIYLGNYSKMSYEIIYKNQIITGSINQDDFYEKIHPLSNETMLYYSESINFHTYTKNIWNPLNPFTYDTNNMSQMFILITLSGLIPFILMSSAIIIKNKMWKKEITL